MNDQAKTQITGVHTVGVPVTDQDRALAFYTGTLGLTKRLADPEVLRWPGAPPMFAFRDQDANRLEIVERA
jgi:hypothetical protein